MATVIPDLSKNEIIALHGSEAEARVYEAIESSLPGHVTVLYSVPWVDAGNGGAAHDGETDFAILDPDRGVMIVEVKGGTVEVSPGGQWSTRGPGGVIEPIANPFTQATRSKHVLKRRIEQVPGVEPRTITFGHAVVLPDMYASPGNLGLEAPGSIMILGPDLENIAQVLTEIYEYWTGEKEGGLKSDLVDLIVDEVFPNTVVEPHLGSVARAVDERVLALSKDQARYIGFLGDQRKVLIEGPAGTGKTVLAVEKARRLAGQGIPTLYTCFNNRLAGEIAERNKKIENLSVWTFHDACKRIAEEAGLEMPRSDSGFDSEFFDSTLPAMLLEALEKLPDKRFGAVILDEAQDLDPAWWELLELMLNDSGDTWLWAFRDSGQNLYDREQVNPSGMQVFHLEENLRNASGIHEAAALHGTGNSGRSVVAEAGSVSYELATNPRATRSVVGRVLHQLVNEQGVERDDIVVLTGTSLGRSSFADVDTVGAFTLTGPDEDPTGAGVDIDSAWRFKGLDRPAVILTDVSGETGDALMYAAMTRARSILVVVGPEEVLVR